MSNEHDYLLILRDQNNRICAGMAHNRAGFLEEFSVLRNFLLNNLRSGAIRAEVHSALPEETFSQTMERLRQEHPRPLATVTKDDLSTQEMK